MGEFAGPRSLRQLLDAVLTVGSDLDLSAMLQRIVQAAVDLVDARYGALGVLDESHTRLAQFITVGVDDESRAAIGNLPLTDKTSAEVFSDVDEKLGVGLAAAAGVAIENARLHARVQELALVEDRERIARDLHDTIVQRLFATGLSLQGATTLIHGDPGTAADRVQSAVDDLDLTIKHIRSAIFGLASATERNHEG